MLILEGQSLNATYLLELLPKETLPFIQFTSEGIQIQEVILWKSSCLPISSYQEMSKHKDRCLLALNLSAM